MKKKFKFILLIYLAINLSNFSIGEENFFNKGLKLYQDKKYKDARLMFERSIVFNQKDSNSYLYLAKIYNIESDQNNEEKNIFKNIKAHIAVFVCFGLEFSTQYSSHDTVWIAFM